MGLNLKDEHFDHFSFPKNRRRLLEHRVSRQFFEAVVRQARRRHLLSAQHFTMDGTLPEAWASMKRLWPRGQDHDPGDGNGYTVSNPDVDFKGQRRSNQTHYSPTDPEALMRLKDMGKETKMSFSGHVVMENRHGLVVALAVTPARRPGPAGGGGASDAQEDAPAVEPPPLHTWGQTRVPPSSPSDPAQLRPATVHRARIAYS